jgi:2'-5' RNA ligase
MSDTWRVFCAIDLPADLKQKLAAHTSQLRQIADVKASWSQADNVHLTVKFLGEIPESHVGRLFEAAARATKPLASFKLTAEHCGVFPTHGLPRVLWIGITDSNKQLTHLNEQLEEECGTAGFPKEARPFHPHLTIARIRHSGNARSLGTAHRALTFEPALIDVSELLVIRSQLGKEGSKYSVISRHVLAERDRSI